MFNQETAPLHMQLVVLPVLRRLEQCKMPLAVSLQGRAYVVAALTFTKASPW
jgi:hypothetical protein